MIKVAINGFGRIGRLVFRIMEEDSQFDIVAINDLTDAKQLAYLLKYDTNYRNYRIDEISHDDNHLIIGDKKIRVYAERDPEKLPWGELGIDQVFECTGHFTTQEGASKHVTAGAKRVIVSAPTKGDVKMIAYNVNETDLTGEETIISGASCTTNCLAVVANLMDKNYGIVKGYMTTVHAYTNDQVILDVAHPKGIESRRGRAGAMNIIPSSTGAASAIGRVIPSLEGKMDGIALRVPTSTGSIVDLTLELEKTVTKEEINQMFIDNQNESVQYTEDPIVSSDIIGMPLAALIDGMSTNIVEVDGKQLVKVFAWYDNEYGYSSQMVRTAKYWASLIK